MEATNLVAKRYANALWQAVGADRANEELKSFDRFMEIYLSSDDLQKLFSNPAFAIDDKRKILTEICQKAGFAKDFQNFVLLLLESGRLSVLGSVLESYREKIMTNAGTHSVKIETALPMNEAVQKKIIAVLEKEFSTKFLATVDIVPDLVAGIRLHFLGRTIDATLTGVLFQMRQSILASKH